MEMTYDGALVMPSSFAMMDEEEMMYLEGGDTSVMTGTAKKLKTEAQNLMLAWLSLTGGYTYAAAAAAASAVGIGVGVLVTAGGAYCAFVANEYREAYNYFSNKSQTSTTKYKMTTIMLLFAITGVECSKA